jgi:DNA primase
MGILDEDVQRVRATASIIEIASEHIALKRVGRRYTGLCPFHAEKSPSFSVNEEEGLFYCFGCQAKGDVITFVREVEHLDFVEAVERLAAKTGIQLRYDDATVSRDRQRRARLVDAMEQAVEWYHQRLLTGGDAAGARSYLRSRGYDGDIVRAFRIGWAPDDWDALSTGLKLPEDVLRDTGLGFLNRRNRMQDSFRARVMFPIFDVRGDPVAFGGRALAGTDGPKYKNSSETPIYSKSRTLYGLNWSKADIVSSSQAIICEGYTDVIGFHLAGLPRAVATCGTALADEHFRTLKNFARKIVLAYDADAAGQAAAERFYEWERRYEIDILVADLPKGADPADVARRDPAALKHAVEHARRFLEFRLHRVLDGGDLSSPEGRARTAEAALAEVSVRLGIAVDALQRVNGRGGNGPRRVAVPARAPRAEAEGPEIEALKLAVNRRDEALPYLHEVLFADDLHLAAFRALVAAEDLHGAIATAGPEPAELLQRLAVEEADAEVPDVVGRVAEAAALRTIVDLQVEARASEDPLDYAPAVAWLKLTIEQLRDPETSVDAAGQLVAWLADRGEEQG